MRVKEEKAKILLSVLKEEEEDRHMFYVHVSACSTGAKQSRPENLRISLHAFGHFLFTLLIHSRLMFLLCLSAFGLHFGRRLLVVAGVYRRRRRRRVEVVGEQVLVWGHSLR